LPAALLRRTLWVAQVEQPARLAPAPASFLRPSQRLEHPCPRPAQSPRVSQGHGSEPPGSLKDTGQSPPGLSSAGSLPGWCVRIYCRPPWPAARLGCTPGRRLGPGRIAAWSWGLLRQGGKAGWAMLSQPVEGSGWPDPAGTSNDTELEKLKLPGLTSPGLTLGDLLHALGRRRPRPCATSLTASHTAGRMQRGGRCR
jgi:hypothetical protein